MSVESSNLDTIFSLISQFESFCSNKFIRFIYETELNTIEIEIVDKESFETLKSVRYKISSQEDIDEIVNILEMYVDKEEK